MIKEKNIIAVIPARSGSKGLKDKNIAPYKDIPLFMHSYNYAKKSLPESQILLSTDSVEYKKIAMSYGVKEDSILIRPKSIAEDNVVDYPVALHAFLHYEMMKKQEISLLIWLRPTSPVRETGLIERSISLIKSDSKITSVRAMRSVSEHPYRIWKKTGDEKKVLPLFDLENLKEPANLPRQSLPDNFLFQSGEIEVVRRTTLQQGSISGSFVCPIFMKKNNPDIDNLADLQDLENPV